MQNKILILLIINIFIIKTTWGQIGGNYLINKKVYNIDDLVKSRNFHKDFINFLIVKKINDIRLEHGLEKLDTLNLLAKAANIQTEYMASTNAKTTKNTNKNLKTTAQRLISCGGSGRGIEFVTKTPLRKNGMSYSYGDIADAVAFYYFNYKKSAAILNTNKYIYIGINVKLDKRKRNIFVSLILGSYLSENKGANLISELPIKVSKPPFFKWNRLLKYDDRKCRKVNKLSNKSLLQADLIVDKNNTIYIQSDNTRPYKRILRNRRDGLAVDIIVKDQYVCNQPNMVDLTLVNRGTKLPNIWSKKFWKSNEIDDKYNKKIKIPIGTIPENIKSQDYELNLLLIQNKHVCASIPQSYLSECEGKYQQKLQILADTITINSKYNYKPKADSTELSFVIPFEKKKYTYKTENIEPFIKLLNEPDFKITNLVIYAYSSIEGIEVENNKLQEQRAQSIVDALKSRQKSDIISKIVTKPAWEQFKKDIKHTKHNIMASMSLEEARNYITKYNLSKELEPILKNHRYAQIDMKVTYDISGDKEQNFVVKQFNKAIKKSNLPLALSIQKYIMKQVMDSKYTVSAIYNEQIPKESKFAGLLMNKLWLNMHANNTSAEEYINEISDLHKLNRYNEYISFNNALCKVLYEPIKDIKEIKLLQNEIDRFYYKSFTKETVDNLNMKFQFKIINSADSIPNNKKIINERIKKIKEIVDIREETTTNIIRLAELFINNKDFKFALELLDPFVEKPDAPEELIFTYLSLCSRFEDMMMGKKIVKVLNIAKKMNYNKYLSLFDGKHFSLRIFENTQIKNSICKSCKTKQITKNTSK